MYIVFVIVYDYEFNGVVFDKILMDYFVKEFFKCNFSVKDFCENVRGFVKFKFEVEVIKRVFSIGVNVSFSVESLFDGIDFVSIINCFCYEIFFRIVFEGINCLVEFVIKKVGFDVFDVDEVILFGGIVYIFCIVFNFSNIFFQIIRILVFFINFYVINFFEFGVCGVVFQVSLIQDYEVDDIDQLIYVVVIIVVYISNVIGVVFLNVVGEEIFVFVVFVEIVVFVKRIVYVVVFKDGGDVFVKFVEGNIYIKVIKFEFKFKEDKIVKVEDVVDFDEEFDFFDDDEEEEEKCEKVWKIGNIFVEVVICNVKKGGKVEVIVQVNVDFFVIFMMREVGVQGGVRG